MAESPTDRARRLLDSLLTPSQRREFIEGNKFSVLGSSGGTFTIAPDGVRGGGRYFCVYPRLARVLVGVPVAMKPGPGTYFVRAGYADPGAARYGHWVPMSFPPEDLMASWKLMLEYDEDLFRKTAN